jgi:hypothetical protein
VTCKEHIDKESLAKATVEWLGDAGFTEGREYEIKGSDIALAKAWIIAFAGDAGTAARRARKALEILKGADGTWRRLEIVSPLGRVLPLFVSADKNRKRILTETYTKRLFGLIKADVPPGKGAIHMLKPEGLITFKWKPLARICVKPDSSFLTYWNPPMVLAAGVDKEKISEAMDSRVATVSAESVEWQL